MDTQPTTRDIKAAASRIGPFIKRTPLLRHDELDNLSGGRIFLKAECLQHTGSFKLRGATNKLQQLSEEERRNGVVAWSSGNHAQGVAAAAKQIGTSAKIVMPSDAPTAKMDSTKRLGAEVIFYDRATEDRYAIALKIAKDEGRVVVPPFNDFDIIAGQGTVGLELMDQADDTGAIIDDVLVPVSGGGLMAGVGLAVKSKRLDTKLYSVEPEGFDDHRRSFKSGKRETNSKTAGSICDALMAPTPGTLTWAINQTQVEGGYAVTEEQALAGMAFAHTHLDLTLEPGGAVALAAILSGAHACHKKTVALILSGGNVDADVFARALTGS